MVITHNHIFMFGLYGALGAGFSLWFVAFVVKRFQKTISHFIGVDKIDKIVGFILILFAMSEIFLKMKF